MNMIAIIGGIGSGKSSVLRYLSCLGERTCDCDEIYRQISNTQEYVELIGKNFAVVKDGAIDKRALGEIVFKDNAQLQKLNDLAHPLVFAQLDRIFCQGEGNLYVEVSAFDKSMTDKFDVIIYVKSKQQCRVDRVKLRNGFDEEYIYSIIQRQMPSQEMEDVADFIIVNESDLEHLQQQVEWIVGWLR